MPLGICLSVSDPGVAETVDPAGTQFGECEPVLGRAVPAIASEPVAGVRLGEGAHRVVTEDWPQPAAATALLASALGRHSTSGPSAGCRQQDRTRPETQVRREPCAGLRG